MRYYRGNDLDVSLSAHSMPMKPYNCAYLVMNNECCKEVTPTLQKRVIECKTHLKNICRPSWLHHPAKFWVENTIEAV